MIPQRPNQQQLNMVAYNQLDLSPGIREALLVAQQAQGNIQIQQPQPQIGSNGAQQQMDYINSARNMMAMNQFQQQIYMQQHPQMIPAPNQLYQPNMFLPQQAHVQSNSPQVNLMQSNGKQQEFIGSQHYIQRLVQYQRPAEESKDPSEFDDKIQEFDQEFLINNPGIIQTQKYFQQNYREVMEQNLMSGELQNGPLLHNSSDWLNQHINLANNNYSHKKKFGINQNRKGKISDKEYQKLQNSIRNNYSIRNELFLNQKFMQQPQAIVEVHRQQKTKLDQQFVHRQYQNQGRILQVLNSLDEKINGIAQNQNYIQNVINNIQDNRSVAPVAQPQIIHQDALAKIRDQVKEELKEELKNKIRQELIDQLPKESQEVLAKNAKYRQQQNLDFVQKSQNVSAQGISDISNKVHNVKSQNLSNLNNGGIHQSIHSSSKENLNNSNNSLNEYKFGKLNDESQVISSSQGERRSKGSKQSKQSIVSSDQLESERLRKSYDEYGKMISDQKKKFDFQKKQIEAINEDIDPDDSDKEELEYKEMKPPMSVKQGRSSSLACNDNSKDILSKQLDQIKQAESRMNAKRNNSIHVGNVLKDSRYGTEGENDHVKAFNDSKHSHYFDANENSSFDYLQIQIEDERLKLLNEIQQIVQKDHHDDIDESNLNNKLKLICMNMNDLDINYSVSRILELSVKQKRLLRELIKKYQEILMHQSKYGNVEHLDNELKSDVDADYDDEDENDDQSSSLSEESSVDGQLEKESYRQSHRGERNQKPKYNKSKQSEIVEKNSDNDVQYENYKPKIEPKALKIRVEKERRGSIASIHSRRKVMQKEYEKNISKKQFQSDDSDDEAFESISRDVSASSSSEENKRNKQMQRSPSLAEIKRRSSYCSIDSRAKKQAAQKFDPKLLKIRDDGSARGSIRSRSSKRSKQAFLQDMISERSGNKRQLSLYRRDKLQGLELDYNKYLQQYQGIFIIRCQMMNIELSKMREKYDLEKMMIEFKNFKKLQKEIKQDEVYRGLQTVIIDIENTFVTLIDIKNKEELDLIREYENFHSDYIIIKKNVGKKSKKDMSKQSNEEVDLCCEHKGTDRCICDLMVYLVRPYTYEILRAIQPFFEIVVFSKLHHKILEHIIDHIESILNKPIREFLEKYQKSMNKSSFQRMKKLPDVKIYFQFIIHQRQYIHIKEYDKHIENLLVLTKNRPKDNLIFISSNPFRIVTAIKYGFLTIPVIQFESFYRDDYQLSLVEHYILKIRHLKDMKKRLRQDFKCLVQKIENQPCKVPGYIKSIQSQGMQFESQSQGSFGGKKLQKKVAEIKDKEQIHDKDDKLLREPQKKIDPALLKNSKPQSLNQPNKPKFKPRKSSFGNISFDGRKQPQSYNSEEDLEDYDDEEECQKKIKKLEDDIKRGVINNKEPPKKKLLFTKIEENKIEENDKEDSEPLPERQSQNPQEQPPQEKPQTQPDLMQYNFQIASQGSIGKNNSLPNPFQSLYRPGLIESNERQRSCQDIAKKMSELNNKGVLQASLSQGEIDNYAEGSQSGGEISKIKASRTHEQVVRKKLVLNKQGGSVVQRSAFAGNKSSSSKTSTDQSVSIQKTEKSSIESPVSEREVVSSKGSLRKVQSEGSSSDPNPQIVQGKVIYDANKVILEESEDCSNISGISISQSKKVEIKKSSSSKKKSGKLSKTNQDSQESDLHGIKSSKMGSQLIDDIYAELDYEQQNAQMQRINEEIENSMDNNNN